MFNFIRNHKAISGLVLVNLIVLVCIIVAIVIHNNKTATVDIIVAPNDAKILINGWSYDNYTSVNFLPGDYTAEISMDGMQTRTINFTLEDHSFYRLHTYLMSESAQSSDDFSYYYNSRSDYETLERIASETDENAQKFVESINKIRSINDQMPLTGWEYNDPESNFATSFFSVLDGNYDDECTKAACLLVSWLSNEPSEDSVNDKVTEAGFSMNDYQVIYREKE